jgi:Mg2+/Co2+ transporter CorB
LNKHHFGTEDGVLIAVVVALIFVTGFLAMAETALTRTSKVKALTLEE